MLVADPPWKYTKVPSEPRGGGRNGTAEAQYPTMTNEQIAALPVSGLVGADAHLFMWVTNPGLYGGRFSDVTPRDIATAWGFEYKTMLTWVKTSDEGDPINSGMGWFFRGCTEHVLYATRGSAGIPADRREKNVVLASRGRHSQKPWEFFEQVERVTDGPYLELFARHRRPRWDVWGNQAVTGPQIARADLTAALTQPGLFDETWLETG